MAKKKKKKPIRKQPSRTSKANKPATKSKADKPATENKPTTLGEMGVLPEKLLTSLSAEPKRHWPDWLFANSMLFTTAMRDADELMENLADPDEDDLARVEPGELPFGLVDDIIVSSGLLMAAYISEPAVKIYVHHLLSELWGRHFPEFYGKRKWNAIEKKLAQVIVDCIRPSSGFPYRFDPLSSLKQADMTAEYKNFQKEMKEWIHLVEPEDEND